MSIPIRPGMRVVIASYSYDLEIQGKIGTVIKRDPRWGNSDQWYVNLDGIDGFEHQEGYWTFYDEQLLPVEINNATMNFTLDKDY